MKTGMTRTTSIIAACQRSKRLLPCVYPRVLKAVCLLIAIELTGVPALAQSLGIGYGKYMGGDFRGAEAALLSATKTKVSASEKAKIYKYLGISQYMLNKKSQAGISFKAAVSLNPDIAIAENEVLDETVLPYFARIKSAVAGAVAQRRAGGAGTSTPQKTTTLKVNSNVSGTILIDGIMAGNTGDVLNVPPGVVELTISAKGYLTKRAKVRVVSNRENTVEIKLSKPKPKPTPRPRVQRRAPSSRSAAERAPAQRRGAFLPDPGAELFNDPSVGGRDLASEFSSDAAGGSYQQPGYPPQPGYGQAYPPQPVYPPQPAYPPQPMYPQQPYGYPPAQPYQPQPVYPQYPPPQPYYPPQPAPAPQLIPAPVPVDPGPALPPADAEPLPPVDFFEDPPAQEKVFDDQFLGDQDKKKKKRKRPRRNKRLRKKPGKMPPVLRAPNKSRRSNKRRRKKARSSNNAPSSTDYIINVLPFGAGQFNNGSYILGGLFFAAEAGALYYYYDNKTKADAAIATAEEYFDDRNESAEDKQKFEEETRVYVDEKRSQQNIGLYSFAGLYVIGVGEAFLNMPSGKPTRKRKRRRRRADLLPSNSVSESVLVEAGSDPSIEAHELSSPISSELLADRKYVSPPSLSFGIMWDNEELLRRSSAPEPGLGLKFDWKF